ncbi:hypothetical protein ACTFIZ_009360 [Dictyostelium cf. discoideum]
MFPLTFLKRFNKNSINKIFTNNYNRSSIFNKAFGIQCLGYNLHGIVHNNFNNIQSGSINRFYSESKVFNNLHENSNTIKPSSLVKEIPTKTVKEYNFKENVKILLENHKYYFNIALHSCGGTKLDDVYNIRYDDFVKTLQARRLVRYYGSMIKICYSLFPNHNWVPWLFRQNNDLSSKRKQPNYDYHDEINWYASINNITSSNLDQWYDISLDEFRKVCKMFMAVSNNQLKSFIEKAYPYHKFDTNKFNKLINSNSFPNFELIESHKNKFTIALNSCGGSELDDIYNISLEDFKKNSNQGESLAYIYGNSIIKICYSLFPDHNWVPWLFKHNVELSNKRNDKENYDYHDEINWYASINNITSSNLDQWYDISLDEFRNTCKILSTVSNSQLISFIEKAYPQIPTSELIENHINQFYIVLNSFGKCKREDVYELGLSDFNNIAEGRSLINYYGRSVIKICYSLFPNHNWVPWLFKQNIDLSNKRKQPNYDYHDEIKWFASDNGIQDSCLDGWYNFPLDNFRSACKIGKAVSNEQLKSFIQKAYPHHNFHPGKFRLTKYKFYRGRQLKFALI